MHFVVFFHGPRHVQSFEVQTVRGRFERILECMVYERKSQLHAAGHMSHGWHRSQYISEFYMTFENNFG